MLQNTVQITVLDAATLGKDLDLSLFTRIPNLSVELLLYDTSTPSEVLERIQNAEVIIINKIRVNEAVLEQAKRLRLVCVAATGYDNIDVPLCRRKGIAVCNVKGYSTDSVAQLTVAMALSLFNRLPEYTEAVKSGAYTASGVANLLTPIYHEIAGKTWGIIGYGNIGRRVGEIASALGCRVLAHRRTPVTESGIVYTDRETIYRSSDIISLHTPLSSETKGMIGKRELAMMKRGTILINVARGAVTDEAAVADAVLSGHLGGVGIDVYSEEPFSASHPFQKILSLPNVCLTPHIAWSAVEARERCMSEIAENIRAFFAGELRNRIDLL